MTDDMRLWTILMLSAGALFTGGLVWYAWERVWIWRRLDVRDFAVDFRRSVRKADPAMPILLVIRGASAGVFAWITEGASRVLALAGLGLMGMIRSARSSLPSRSTVSFAGAPRAWCRRRPSNSGAGGEGFTSPARAWA